MKITKAKAAVKAQNAARAADEDTDMDEELEELRAKVSKLEGELDELRSEDEDEEPEGKAKAKKAKAKSEHEEPDGDEECSAEADEDGEAQARVIAAAKAATGMTSLSGLPGAIMALQHRAGSAGSPKDRHSARVKKLVAEGLIAPAMRKWAMSATSKDVDVFLKATGGAKIAPLGEETEPDHEDGDQRREAFMSGRGSASKLSASEGRIAAKLGIDPAVALKAKGVTLATGIGISDSD